MSDLTTADIETLALRLGVDTLRTTWEVELRAKVVGSRQANLEDGEWSKTNFTENVYVECAVWRTVDQDYDHVKDIALGMVTKEGSVVRIALLDGLDIDVIKWIARLCKERKVKIEAPPSARALAEALR